MPSETANAAATTAGGNAAQRPPRKQVRLLTRRGKLRGQRKWVVAMLFVIPLTLIALKLAGFPYGNEFLSRASSLAGLGGDMESRVGSILLVPLAAVIVVFFRVTLGLRVLGPFRSFLLAVAFQATGIGLGLLFLTVVIGVIVLIRRPLKRIRLPYYARISVVMSTVATTIAAAVAVSRAFHIDGLHRVAYFPIVALCLTGDAFSSTLKREGPRSALWRGAMTAIAAVLITEIARIPGFVAILIRFPELLMLEIGMIILIAEFFGHRLFSFVNPPPAKKRRRSRKSRSAKAPRKTSTSQDGLPPVPIGLTPPVSIVEQGATSSCLPQPETSIAIEGSLRS